MSSLEVQAVFKSSQDRVQNGLTSGQRGWAQDHLKTKTKKQKQFSVLHIVVLLLFMVRSF